jgi:uncharacterized membrane protein YedE/YeeE
MQGKHIAFGALFGFILSRAGATDYDAISGMFQLTDLHLFGVIGLAVAVSAAGFFVARRRGLKALNGEPLLFTKKPMTRGLAAGALLFGAGWGLSGTCPGTVLAQIGEGRLAGLATFSGILLGAWLQGRQERRKHGVEDDSPARVGASSAAA